MYVMVRDLMRIVSLSYMMRGRGGRCILVDGRGGKCRGCRGSGGNRVFG